MSSDETPDDPLLSNPQTNQTMKKHAILALLGVVAVAFTTVGCGGGCTTETHTVTIRDRYVPPSKPVKKSNPESFEPVERF